MFAFLIKAGIPDNQLEIVVEPEAASIYCHLMDLDEIQEHDKANRFTRKPGIKYMVLDLGGKCDFCLYRGYRHCDFKLKQPSFGCKDTTAKVNKTREQ